MADAKTNGNENAFPRQDDVFNHGSDGLTKREWFAGMALIGFCANPEFCHNSAEWQAKESYRCADAMLKAGERGDG